MSLKVEIDARSGFCGGVIRAIGQAERFLDEHPGKILYSLGDIVHNEAELSRLRAKGLVTVSHEDLPGIPEPETQTLLIRAHGEPPSTYSLARSLGLTVIDCTCPVVLRLQGSIRDAYAALKQLSNPQHPPGGLRGVPLRLPESLRSEGVRGCGFSEHATLGTVRGGTADGEEGKRTCSLDGFGDGGGAERSEASDKATASDPPYGQLIIFGKVGHAEVLGLLGQVGGDAVVIENMNMLHSALEDGTIRTDVPLEIFSQTTKSPTEYSRICEELKEMAQAGLTVHQTICSQVASRHEQLASFAARHDVILFVSGASSSNGKVLFELCKSWNPRTYHISSPEEIDRQWFGPHESVGVCGATSTPRWLLEQVAKAIS